jgi:small nuclear ribonucleoprotein (snRNP)-like protein
LIELNVNPNVKRISAKVKRLRGQPVCVVLNDGSYYVGWITGIEKNEFILSANKGQGKLNHTSSRHSKKAMVSGLFPALGSLLGGAGGANVLPTPTGAASADSGASGGLGWLGGLSGFMGFMQKAVPMFRMGYGMVKTIMPLFGGFKA